MFVNVLETQESKVYELAQQKPQVVKNAKINFGTDEDCYTPSIDSLIKIQTSDFSADVSEVEKEKIKKNVLKIAKGDVCKPLGSGADGAVYKTDNNLVVKISHTENKNPITGEMQRTKVGYETEIEMLKSVSGFDENSQKYIANFKLNDGRTALVTTLVEGVAPGIEKNEKKLNKDSLSSLLKVLYTLDERNVLHRDLKKENIKISNSDKAGLFDFGAAIRFDIRDFKKNTKDNHFPEFEIPTNLRNFEDTLLSPYLHELSKTNPKEAKTLFREYLGLKSEFHAKKAEFVKETLQDKSLTNKEKKKLSEIIHYEETLASVFNNPDDDIIETELLKNNITYNTELAYKNEILLLNPLANVSLKMNALISAKKLEKLMESKINRPNTKEKKDYYEYKRQEAKFRQYKIGGWMSGLTGWLVECLTPRKNTNASVDNIINQCCDKNKNLSDFEIPNLQDEVIIKEQSNKINENTKYKH